jgi:hypothetical protein
MNPAVREWLRAEAERVWSAEEAREYLTAPMSEEERAEILDLVRWFTRRYPTPIERLRYVTRAYKQWTRPLPEPQPSAVAREVAEQRAKRHADWSPAERVTLAQRLGEEAVQSYMLTHRVDRATAVSKIKATHRLGRRRSASAAADEH